MVKVKSRLNKTEILVGKLHKFSLDKSNIDEDRKRSKSLIAWFNANNHLTDRQISLGKKLTYELKDHTKNKKQYLYAISNGDQIKIGMSSDVDKRLIALQTSNHGELVVLWKLYVADNSKIAIDEESRLHRLCHKYKIRGEWFEYGCLDIIKEFKSNDQSILNPVVDSINKDGLFKITESWINGNKTSRGGWTKKQLKYLGVSWPPSKGWKKLLNNTYVDLETKYKFEN